MPDNDPASLSALSDAELAAMELDKSLPIDTWMAVEAERGRRDKARKAQAAAARAAGGGSASASTSAPSQATQQESPAADDPRLSAGVAELRQLLVPGEKLLVFAAQRRLFALTHRREIVAATTGRFIALRRGLLGGYTPLDMRWQDLKDVSIRAGVFGATLTVSAMENADLASREHLSGRMVFEGLRKTDAQEVYKVCQAQEQAWREKRRVRDLDELRAESGGIQLGGTAGIQGATTNVSMNSDPTERLRRAKEMLDSGLITDAEYESIKARVVDGL